MPAKASLASLGALGSADVVIVLGLEDLDALNLVEREGKKWKKMFSCSILFSLFSSEEEEKILDRRLCIRFEKEEDEDLGLADGDEANAALHPPAARLVLGEAPPRRLPLEPLAQNGPRVGSDEPVEPKPPEEAREVPQVGGDAERKLATRSSRPRRFR